LKKKDTLFRKFIKVFWVVYAIASVIVTISKADALITKDYPVISQHVSLDDSWDVTINNNDYHNISIGDFQFQPVDKGDNITLQRILPENWDIIEGALRIHIKQSSVRMFIDNELIYEYGYNRARQGKTLGNGYLFINFPSKYKGKTLKIQLTVTEDNVFTKFDSIRIYEWENAYRVIMTENRIPMFLGSFLVILGIVAGVITIFALYNSIKFLKLFCVTMFSICMGLWTLCYYKVILIFSIPLYSVSLIEYISLYLAPLPVTIYMHEDVQKLKNKVIKLFYKILVTIQLITVVTTMILHTFDIVHFAATLKYMHTIIFCSLIYFFIVLVLNLKSSHQTETRLFLVGMLVVIICVTYDLIGYSIKRYLGNTLLSLKGVSSIGIMVFIFILIAIFYMDMTKKVMQETERNFLLKSAYTDEMTQLHNRRYCTEYMQNIQNKQDCSYTVICFDLNNLKVINDTYGHARGDILIKSAAEVIAETFKEYGIVARMGGDEFIAILETADINKIKELEIKLQKNIDKKNKEIEDLNMSIAYGYAYGNSLQNNIEKLYQEADDHMYEHKMKMKQSGIAAQR